MDGPSTLAAASRSPTSQLHAPVNGAPFIAAHCHLAVAAAAARRGAALMPRTKPHCTACARSGPAARALLTPPSARAGLPVSRRGARRAHGHAAGAEQAAAAPSSARTPAMRGALVRLAQSSRAGPARSPLPRALPPHAAVHAPSTSAQRSPHPGNSAPRALPAVHRGRARNDAVLLRALELHALRRASVRAAPPVAWRADLPLCAAEQHMRLTPSPSSPPGRTSTSLSLPPFAKVPGRICSWA